MAYIPTVWKNRVVEFPRRFVKQNETANSVELVPDPGVVTEEGTPVNAVNLNKIEQGIEDAHETADEAASAISAHASRTDNPHSVTKAQVGLGSVQNYGIASQAQAQAGSANNVYMTPLRTKQAIDTFTGGIPFRINDGELEYYDGGEWKPVSSGRVLIPSNTIQEEFLDTRTNAGSSSFVLAAKHIPKGTGEIYITCELNTGPDRPAAVAVAMPHIRDFGASGGGIKAPPYVGLSHYIHWGTPLGTTIALPSDSRHNVIGNPSGSGWVSASGRIAVMSRVPIYLGLVASDGGALRNLRIRYDVV